MSQNIINATKTTRPTTIGLQRTWYVLDAGKESLGRIATKAASLMIGKNRADYSPDVDMGAMVVIINAKKTVLTGKKKERKNYFTHSGQVGGLKILSFQELHAKDCTKPIYQAVKRMLPKNRQQDVRMNNRLYIFAEDHDIKFKLNPAN